MLRRPVIKINILFKSDFGKSDFGKSDPFWFFFLSVKESDRETQNDRKATQSASPRREISTINILILKYDNVKISTIDETETSNVGTVVTDR